MALSTLHGTQLIRGLSSQWLPRLRQVGREAKAMGLNAFLVGGTVRDLLLKHPSGDPDIVVVGNPEPLVRRLGARWRATVLPHPQFLTFVLTFPDGTHLDVATARGERYETPAALPQVSPASIEEDLWRRDFSINALALGLNPSAWGQLLDPTGGLQDLQQLKIRVLHARSFWDDPTRIFRAARFAGRYQFTLEAQTLQWLREALIRRLPRRLSPERRREELWAIVDEPQPLFALRLLARWGGLKELIQPVASVTSLHLSQRFHRCTLQPLPLESLQRLRRFILFSEFTPRQAKACLQKLRVPNAERECIVQGLELWRWVRAGEKGSRRGGGSWSGDLPFDQVRRLSPEMLTQLDRWMVTAAGDAPRLLERWQRLQHSLPRISGRELERLGYHPGPQFWNMLMAIVEARWRGKVRTPSEEVRFIIDNYPPP